MLGRQAPLHVFVKIWSKDMQTPPNVRKTQIKCRKKHHIVNPLEQKHKTIWTPYKQPQRTWNTITKQLKLERPQTIPKT